MLEISKSKKQVEKIELKTANAQESGYVALLIFRKKEKINTIYFNESLGEDLYNVMLDNLNLDKNGFSGDGPESFKFFGENFEPDRRTIGYKYQRHYHSGDPEDESQIEIVTANVTLMPKEEFERFKAATTHWVLESKRPHFAQCLAWLRWDVAPGPERYFEDLQ